MLRWANIFQVTFFNYTERQVPQATNPPATTTQADTHTHTLPHMHSHKQTNLLTLPPSPCHSHTQPHSQCLATQHLPFHRKSSEHTNTAQILGERAKYVNKADCKTLQGDCKKHIEHVDIVTTGFLSQKCQCTLSYLLNHIQ